MAWQYRRLLQSNVNISRQNVNISKWQNVWKPKMSRSPKHCLHAAARFFQTFHTKQTFNISTDLFHSSRSDSLVPAPQLDGDHLRLGDDQLLHPSPHISLLVGSFFRIPTFHGLLGAAPSWGAHRLTSPGWCSNRLASLGGHRDADNGPGGLDRDTSCWSAWNFTCRSCRKTLGKLDCYLRVICLRKWL